jgi:hypothetical protein
VKKTDHLRDPANRAKGTAARLANRANTPRTTRPGSETCDWHPGTPVRVSRSGVPRPYAGRKGWVAVVNTQTFEIGPPAYTEVGVTFSIATDWARASADAWFRVDELTADGTQEAITP